MLFIGAEVIVWQIRCSSSNSEISDSSPRHKSYCHVFSTGTPAEKKYLALPLLKSALGLQLTLIKSAIKINDAYKSPSEDSVKMD